jgi:CRP/FNR family transcriptional regulator, cyclic AMP receptor protein
MCEVPHTQSWATPLAFDTGEVGYNHVLCGRLRNTDQHFAEIALQELPTRLANALLRFASAEKRSTSRGGLGPQQTLANVCGASRESINRCLGGWQRRGIGETEKRTIRKLLDEELAEQNG